MSVDRDEIKRRALRAIDSASDDELDRGKKDEKYAHDWLQDAIGWISGLITILGGIFYGCFITTALSERKGWGDDCEMMEDFRALRNELSSLILGVDESYSLYCHISPSIVKWANTRGDSELIWNYLEKVVFNAHSKYKAGHKVEAYNYFKDSILSVRSNVAIGEYVA